ncbi:MAG: phosphotransferase [Rhodospirillaceae bacterium]
MADTSLPAPFLDFLRRTGLAGVDETPAGAALTGGVSSDIWRVELARGPVCVKRALDKLKVAEDWRAPIARNAYEVAWMETAGALVPGAAPEVLAHDAEAGMFAMPYLDPAAHRLWKTELRDGRADPAFAAACGRALGRIHAGTAGDADIAAAFATDDIFHAIRLEPYLEATARRHADVADRLLELVALTASNRLALVHGDVSPKNILVTAHGPIFLDAECAWYGDLAFDLAFCLNHFLLKCLWTPAAAPGFMACLTAMAAAYADAVDPATARAVEMRTAHLLPGLFLARVDGKSPVEYVTDDADKDRVRRVAKALLTAPVDRIAAVRAAWERELGLKT